MNKLFLLVVLPALVLSHAGPYMDILKFFQPKIENIANAINEINNKNEELFSAKNIEGLGELYSDHAEHIHNGQRLEGINEAFKGEIESGVRRLVVSFLSKRKHEYSRSMFVRQSAVQ